MAKQRPTIIDVARRAGVSKSTVSLAMRNSPLLKEETCKKVQTVARKMGYRPNMLFSVMGSGNRMQGRSEIIPIAFLYDAESDYKNSEIIDFRYLPEIAEKYRYSVDPICAGDYKTTSQLKKVLYNRGYLAVIIGRVLKPDSIINELDLQDFTVISNTNTMRKGNYHRVSGDVFGAVQVAWDKCVQAGYHRIGAAVCRHEPSVPDDELRIAAVLERQRFYADVIEYVPPYAGIISDYNSFVKWAIKYQPDAVVGLHVGQYYALKEYFGEKCPGFACLIVLSDYDPEWAGPLSGVLYPEKEVASVTISILDQEIRNRAHGMPEIPMRVTIPPKWHEGETLKIKKINTSTS